MFAAILILYSNSCFNIKAFPIFRGFLRYLKMSPRSKARVQVPKFAASVILLIWGAQTRPAMKDVQDYLYLDWQRVTEMLKAKTNIWKFSLGAIRYVR